MTEADDKGAPLYAKKIINDRECWVIPPKRGFWYFAFHIMIIGGPIGIGGGFGLFFGVYSLIWVMLLGLPTYVPVNPICYAVDDNGASGIDGCDDSGFDVQDDFSDSSISDDNWLNSSTDFDSSITTSSMDLFNNPVNDWFSGNIFHHDD